MNTAVKELKNEIDRALSNQYVVATAENALYVKDRKTETMLTVLVKEMNE